MSEKENDTKKMLETLRKLPEKTQEKIGYMIEGAALVSGAHEDEPKKDGGMLCRTGRRSTAPGRQDRLRTARLPETRRQA